MWNVLTVHLIQALSHQVDALHEKVKINYEQFGMDMNIHLIPKWQPINYSFDCMLISLLCLLFTLLTRRRGLINMQTKE